MNIEVEYINQMGTKTNSDVAMSRLALIKHLAIAGQHYMPAPKKIARMIGMFAHYACYLQRQDFNQNRFSEPRPELSDPTEKAQFSNLAGKAIADYLSKKLSNSLHTVNYEAAMRINGHKIKGQRPDLIAYTPSEIFAIEEKGRHQNNPGNMVDHKLQSQSGPIGVNFSVACISYYLFDRIKCNYHDPVVGNVPYDEKSLKRLTQKYYSGLAQFLNSKNGVYREILIQGETFLEVEIFDDYLRKVFSERWFPRPWHYEARDFFLPRLILPGNIRQLAESGISNQNKPFIFDDRETRNIYIDNDRVGLSVPFDWF